jgi:transposase
LQRLQSGLSYKRLERGRFPDPQTLAARGLSMAEVMAFLEGIDLSRVKRIAPVSASRVA